MYRERRRVAALVGLISASVLLLGPGAGGAADTGPQLQAIARSVQDVDLRWTPAPTDGCGTAIWRDGASLATLCGSASTFIDTGVEPGTRYRYQVVTAAPGAGPALSNEVTLTTPSLPEGLDVTPPSRATDLQALASEAGVLLSWQSASDDTDVSAYEVRARRPGDRARRCRHAGVPRRAAAARVEGDLFRHGVRRPRPGIPTDPRDRRARRSGSADERERRGRGRGTEQQLKEAP